MINNQFSITKNKMKKLIHIFTMIAMGSLPVWLSGCGGGDGHAGHGHDAHGDEAVSTEGTLSEAAMRQHEITTDPVKSRTLRPMFSVPARVAFNHETMAHVGTLVKGRVSEMNVHLGDTIKEGDVLFTIESPELGMTQNAFLKALDSEAAAQPALQLAQNNAGVAQAQAAVKAAEAMLASANNPSSVAQAKGKLNAADRDAARISELYFAGGEGFLGGGEP